jgi:pyridoxine kinase
VFLANVLDGHSLPTSLARTTSSVFAVVEATAEAGEREMRIVQTQDRLADPRMEFEPEKLR